MSDPARFLLFLIVLLALGLLAAGFAPDDDPPAVTTTVTVPVEKTYQGKRLRWWSQRAVRNRRVINKQRRSLTASAKQTPPWGNHWLERAFACIHAHEGAWNDPRAPYWGGLQMDSSFQATYGAEFVRAFGTADRWPASVQIAVAIRAWLSRGFGPWPTRRFCGL